MREENHGSYRGLRGNREGSGARTNREGRKRQTRLVWPKAAASPERDSEVAKVNESHYVSKQKT